MRNKLFKSAWLYLLIAGLLLLCSCQTAAEKNEGVSGKETTASVTTTTAGAKTTDLSVQTSNGGNTTTVSVSTADKELDTGADEIPVEDLNKPTDSATGVQTTTKTVETQKQTTTAVTTTSTTSGSTTTTSVSSTKPSQTTSTQPLQDNNGWSDFA